jgi:hypothetical protein
LAIARDSFFEEIFVVTGSSVLHINICAAKPSLRKSADRTCPNT